MSDAPLPPRGPWARLLARLEGRSRRRRARNQWLAQSSQREILGSLSLGAARSHELRNLWRIALWAALALIAFQAQAGLLLHVGPELVRLDVAALFVAFFVLRLGAIEGALASFAVGYVADLFVQGPPGLCRFLAVGVWTAGRLLAPRAGFASWAGRLLFVFGVSATYQLGVLGGLQLVAGPESLVGRAIWLSVLPQALVAAAVALPGHAMLSLLERRTSPGRV